ncbi:DUF1983 domain-containing protein [Proteus vulgaris]|uniref:TipJ family phage tail tip protein n=1 Tax=Proteus vulgaris TaxID=585 RepID=UPI0018E4869E|nr:phage tail protein [Proteus vulgaris]MBI6530899.1 DUF1983 domain-containing protein [Proteus vulgaris]
MGKGGGSGSTPRLVDDNLKNKQILNIIDLVSEGPIEGPVGGMQGFLLNETPVVDNEGNTNIHGVDIQWKSGTQSQEPLEGFSFVEKEVPVNVSVKQKTPILRVISDKETDRVRLTLGVSSLTKQDLKGNQENTSVDMLIEVNDGSGWVNEKRVTIGPGKISGQYLESHIINAPTKKPFQIRVSRVTEDSKNDLLRNDTLWASYTEITDAKFSYPNSAIVGMKIDSSQYGEMPNRTYHIKGMIIQVPDNYDPNTRNYNGIWTGKFKPAWTDNPAWIFYDLVTNERYGIGSLIGQFGVDKFALYAIARYCDELVPDGFGGKEPRFTFNAYITSQRKAKEVLDDLSSVFRGMPLWDGQQLTCFQDRTSDPVWTYTNSNVIDGKFNYSSTAKSARHNAIEISWVNPENGWEEEREFIQHDELVERFGGLNVKKVTAFGCTSRGQAHRVGKWILETERLETETVNFTTAREGISCTPGDIIEVADDTFAGEKVGGRVLSFDSFTIRIDAPISWNKEDKGHFSYLSISGKLAKVEIENIQKDIVTLKEKPIGIQNFGVFSISKNTLTTQLFRVINISEETEGNYHYTCIEHEPQKEKVVDEGADFTRNPSTINTIRLPKVERLSISYIEDSTQVQARATWVTASVNRNITFDINLYRNNKFVSTNNSADLEYYFNGLTAGEYSVGVRAKDANGMLGDETKVVMVIGTPAAPSLIRTEPGFFEIKVIPYISAPHTLNTEFEFWFAGEKRINNINDIETLAEFLGRAKFWTKGQLKAGRDYWFYVRSINEYGKSHFIEAKGQAEDNTEAILDGLGEQFISAEAGKQLDTKLNWLSETAIVQSNASHRTSRDLLVKHGQSQAGIKELWQVRATDNEAWAQTVTQLYSSIDNAENTFNSEIKEVKTSISKLDQAFGQTTTEIRTEITTTSSATNQRIDNTNNNLSGTNKNLSITNQNLDKTNQNLDKTNHSLQLTDKEIVRVAADVVANKEAISKTNQAMAKSEEQVQAQFGKQQGMINQKMQAEFSQTGNGVVTHSINITIVHNNVKYNAAGQVISAQVKNGKLESYIGYNANNFAWYNPVNGKMELFMYVKNGQMFMREAFINEAWLNSVVVTEYIKSGDYVPGKSGFLIDGKTSNIEMNKGTFRGELDIGTNKTGAHTVITNERIAVYGDKGELRVEIGKITGV